MTATLMQKLPAKKIRDNSSSKAQKLLRGYLHKTSNSLCGIKGYAGLIAAGEKPDSGNSRWARKILAEIERMEDIFRNVGDLTTGSAPFLSGGDLAGVIHQAISRTRETQPGLRVSTSVLPSAELLLPEADLNLILMEILKNSAQAHGAVRVEITGQVEITGRVVLRLADNGPGMTPDLLKMATDPFVTTRDGHHGVGLTRVDTLCDMHGLAWSLASHPGTGTTVTLEVAKALNWTPEIV